MTTEGTMVAYSAGVEHCMDFAQVAASHHQGDGKLHGDAEAAHEIFQVSTMTALLDAVYDGGLTYAELEQHGDFGLGTFNALDGEMIAIDGAFFHLHADGSAAPVDPHEQTPFAAVTFFTGDVVRPLPGPMSRAAVHALLDEMIPSENLFYAVRIDGRFSRVTTRTAAKQAKPYRPLTAATGDQAESEFTDVVGTIAGFRAPNYAQGLTVAGYHLHFIDDGRTRGGHVFDFEVEEGTLLVDQDAGLHVELPQTPEFLSAHLDDHAVDAEIALAEGDRR